MTMAIIAQFRDQVCTAAANGTALRIRGGGTKDWYGGRLEGEILDTRGHTGIVDYEPTELVITARCGTPLAEIEMRVIRETLRHTRGDKRLAAKLLGIATRTIYRKLESGFITEDAYRPAGGAPGDGDADGDGDGVFH